MSKLAIFVTVIAAACGTTATSDPSSPQATGERWECFTRSECAVDAPVVQQHELCVTPSSLDVELPGDAAVQDWKQLWSAACNIDQGTGLSDDGTIHECRSGAQAEPYTCDVECNDTFQACAP